MSRRRLALLVGIAALAAAFVFWPEREQLKVEAIDHDVTINRASSPDDRFAIDETDAEPADSPTKTDSEAPCVKDMEGFMLAVRNEMQRLAVLLPRGEEFVSYRGLGEQELLSLVSQSDSRAMVVLAKRAEMLSRGKPPDTAIDYLDGYTRQSEVYFSDDLVTDLKRVELRKAIDWYYEAALNGRVMALVEISFAARSLGLGPVDLGWIDRKSFEALDPVEQRAWNMFKVYHEAALALSPEIADSPVSVSVSGPDPEPASPLAVQIVVQQFLLDQKSRGLSMPVVPPYSGPSLEALQAMRCAEQ